MFLDCEFDVNHRDTELHYVGVLLTYETEGAKWEIGNAADGENFPLRHPFLRATAFRENPGVVKVMADDFFLIEPDPADIPHLEITGREPAWSSAAQNAIASVVMNFIDILNDSNAVTVVPIRRGAKNVARRKRQGKRTLPPSDKVVLKLPLRRYVDALKAGGHFAYSYRFWVRGHWRTLRAERYKTKRGTRRWILPYIKGPKGALLIKKLYEMRGESESCR